MRILPQLAKFWRWQVPPTLRVFRLILRFTLLALGVYAVYRGERTGKVLAAQQAAELQAYEEQLRRETEAEDEQFDDQMTRIYRGINTVLSYAGLESIGDGD